MKKKHPLLRHSLTSLVSWCLAALVALDGLVVLRPVLQHACLLYTSDAADEQCMV